MAAAVEGLDDEDPVAAAARQGNLQEVQRLLSSKCDPNVRDVLGETPLFEASARNDISMAKALIAARADTTIRSHAGNKAFELASTDAFREAMADESEPAAAEDSSGQLAFAARQGDLAEVRRLLAAKADPNQQDVVGETPLFEAAASGSVSVTATLLLAGADPDHTSLMGSVPLDLAASSPVRALLRLCIGEKIEFNERDSILDSLVPELRIPVKRFIYSLTEDTEAPDGADLQDREDLELLNKSEAKRQMDDDDDDEDFDFEIDKSLLLASKPKAAPPKPVVDIELVVSHAIQEGQIVLKMRSNNTFGDVKKLISERLSHGGDAQSIYLVRKEREAYQAYKDREIIGDVRHVRMVGATLPKSS